MKENMSNKIKIMIATPAYNGQVDIPYCLSFAGTYSILLNNGIDVEPLVVMGSSLLVSERNRIIEAFWNSDCTHILCIDSDLGWPPQAVLAMLQEKKDIIVGVYPARSKTENSFTFRPALNEDKSFIQDRHLLKMEAVPAGFMLISKDCIRKMRDFYPELYYCPKNEEMKLKSGPAYAFFNTLVIDGEFWGEDYVFCKRIIDAGMEIWCDPLIQFDHAGKVGMFVECLTSNSQSTVQNNKNNIINIGK
jgi:hypothetical protein